MLMRGMAILICILCMCSCTNISKEELDFNSANSVSENTIQLETGIINKKIYSKIITDKIISHPTWIGDSLVCWATEQQTENNRLYKIYIADPYKQSEKMVFQKEVDAYEVFDFKIEDSDKEVHLYLKEGSTTSEKTNYRKLILEKNLLTVLHEETFENIIDFSWNNKSKQDIVVQKVCSEENSFDIKLFSLYDPKTLSPLKLSHQVRYDFLHEIWAPSGELFILANCDAYGMNKFESLADLRAFPYSEWPTKLQFDIYKKDGSYAFAFSNEFIFRDDGSKTTYDIWWISQDHLFVSSTFYDGTLNSKRTKEKIFDNIGIVIYEKEYAGDSKNYLRSNFTTEGIYYAEEINNGVHLMYVPFTEKEAKDYGVVATDEIGYISLQMKSDENALLVCNSKKEFEFCVLQFQK